MNETDPGLQTAGTPAVRPGELSREAYIYLGAGAAVLLQLANPGVGWGVSEHSTTLRRPLDRLRTTMIYIYALNLGSEQERRMVAQLVNRAHGPVHSERYSAFDPQLQLWVAATLYRSGAQLAEIFNGPLGDADAEILYQHAAIYGTALQVRPDMWPPNRAAFEAYWTRSLESFSVDDQVRSYAQALLRGGAAPWWTRVLLPLQSFTTRGLLPPAMREAFGLPWSRFDQLRWDRFLRYAPMLYRWLPRWVRHAPASYFLRDMRRRIAAHQPPF
ncbi:MAG: oxygenase MpaB family protein [Pseudomonadota bacterium]